MSKSGILMREGLMLFCIVLFLTGGMALSKADEMPSDSDQNVRIINQLYNAFQSGDVDTILGLMDDEVIWFAPGPSRIKFAGTFHGKDGVRKFFDIAIENLEVLAQEVKGYLIGPDTVGVMGYEHMKVKSTGRHYESDWIHLYTLRDGKIVAFEEYVDTAAQAAAFDP